MGAIMVRHGANFLRLSGRSHRMVPQNRHPAYTGAWLIAVGIATVLFPTYLHQINVKEPALLIHLGLAYSNYR